MAREMLINIAEGEECRIAVVEKGVLEELYVERANLAGHVGSIYKAKVVNIEPGIQAAFVDFGIGKNGFLHISDLHPRYFSKTKEEDIEVIGRRKSLKERPPIQACLKKGQELIVQVTKEGIKTKGPTLTTYLALPGRYLVMMPWMNRLGVSHKIEDEEERKRLRELFENVKLPEGMGFIIRTAGQGCSKRDIQNDLAYLNRLWGVIEKRMETETAPAELYQESDLVIRTLRDVVTSQISKIICDSEKVSKQIRDFLYIAMPRLRNRVALYDGNVPLFHKYGIELEINKIQSRRVELPSGGSIVIDQTEAIVAIDVNSGRSRAHANAEQTAFKINLEAAAEIARQLRLRDLGGLIICDFIDMREEKHRREVEKVFRNALRIDRARSRILRMSRFGIIEMTRQRMRPSLESSTYLECPHCSGRGIIKSHESLSLEIIRMLNAAAAQKEIRKIELFVAPEAAGYLLNIKRMALAGVEQLSGKSIIINSDPSCFGEKHKLVCYNERGSIVKL
jgi:ribonuclease E